VQAVVSAHPPAPSSSRQPSCWPVARHVRLRNPIKSTLAHDVVAAVVSHKHHLIIRVSAGLIQFVYGLHSRLAADLTLDTNLFSLPFSRGTRLCIQCRRAWSARQVDPQGWCASCKEKKPEDADRNHLTTARHIGLRVAA